MVDISKHCTIEVADVILIIGSKVVKVPKINNKKMVLRKIQSQ